MHALPFPIEFRSFDCPFGYTQNFGSEALYAPINDLLETVSYMYRCYNCLPFFFENNILGLITSQTMYLSPHIHTRNITCNAQR